jgi:hypothetical protein
MDKGYHLIKRSVPFTERLQQVLATIPESEWRPVHPDGKYASPGWQGVHFVEKGSKKTEHYQLIADLLAEHFPCPIHLCVFYRMNPGAWIKPHRDASGTLEFGRIRFHVPLVTHDDVDFRVDGERIWMRPGELWALNTSHTHQVDNHSSISRVHFVIEATANSWVWSQLPPRGWAYYRHGTLFMASAGLKFVRAFARPKKARAYLSRLVRVVVRRT